MFDAPVIKILTLARCKRKVYQTLFVVSCWRSFVVVLAWVVIMETLFLVLETVCHLCYCCKYRSQVISSFKQQDLYWLRVLSRAHNTLPLILKNFKHQLSPTTVFEDDHNHNIGPTLSKSYTSTRAARRIITTEFLIYKSLLQKSLATIRNPYTKAIAQRIEYKHH